MQYASYSFLLLILLACGGNKNIQQVKKEPFDKQGHRGCRGLMPENTIEGMYVAMDLGVSTLEMDVVVSKDKKVVVSHDPYFSSVLTTGPGGKTFTQKEAEALMLYQMDYDSIRRYDVGMKFQPLFPEQKKIAAVKPLLSELVDATETYGKKKIAAVRYNIEIKSTPEGDGSRHPPVAEFVDLVVGVINQKNITSKTVVQSFDIRALQIIHAKYPHITTALLIEEGDHRELAEQLSELGFQPPIYSPHYSLVTDQRLEQCHAQGIKVIPWTVNK